MKNHLGSYECKLCLTLHNNEVSETLISMTVARKVEALPGSSLKKTSCLKSSCSLDVKAGFHSSCFGRGCARLPSAHVL